MKVKTFSSEKLKLSASAPSRVRVNSSSSTSDTEIVVTAVWFSSIVKFASDVNSGTMSFTFVISMITSLVSVSVPSVKDRVIE